LKSGGRVDGRLALSTLFDLARRGAVRIDEQPRQGRWGSRAFMVIRGDVPSGLRPHEREVLALAFPDGKGAQAKLSDIATRMTMKGGAFKKALTEELDQARWLSADRLAARRRLWVTAGAVLATGLLTIVIALLTRDYWGAWGVLLPAGLAVAAGVGFVLTSTIPVLSDDGLRQANRWRGFATEVKTLSRSQSGPAGAQLDHWFAYAVAFGLGAAWAKRLDAAGLADTVGWLRVVAAPNGARSSGFVAMMSGTGSAGGASGVGAGGGGGAAGGGSSGAH
jgi:hypothetical protein